MTEGSSIDRPGWRATDTSGMVGSDDGTLAWQTVWKTDVDLDPRLVLKVRTGPAGVLAWGVVDDRPMIAVCGRDNSVPNSSVYRLRVWDIVGGLRLDVDCEDNIAGLAFVVSSPVPVLVSGHDAGVVCLWNLSDGSLHSTFKAGTEDIANVHVLESGRDSQLMILDDSGVVTRWSVATGSRLGALEAHEPKTFCGGYLADGRAVLLTAGRRLMVWDLVRGVEIPVRMPPDVGGVHDVVLATAEGRDILVVTDERDAIVAFDPFSGAETSARILAHQVHGPESLMAIHSGPSPVPRLAVVRGFVAVPTEGRVRIWDLHEPRQWPAVTGPVASSTALSVSWGDRKLLLTGSQTEGVVALWDLDMPVSREPGHQEDVVDVDVVASADVVVSVDAGGTIVTRSSADGRRQVSPLTTDVERTQALAAWADGDRILAVTGAGTLMVPDGRIRRWDLTAGRADGDLLPTHRRFVHWIARAVLAGIEALVSYGPNSVLRLWRLDDGSMVSETSTETVSMVTGLATGLVDGRTAVLISTVRQPMRVHWPNDPSMRARTLLAPGNDIVFDMVGSVILTAQFPDGGAVANTVRAWSVDGTRVGAEVAGTARVVAAAVRNWPDVYIGRADGTVSLTDMSTGRDHCPPMSLQRAPRKFKVLSDGDLIAAFGSDVGRFSPPRISP